ncbi:MAG TPA: HNH endonuclease [Thermomicrobiaceae bacterium]|nr:HNH endonuclease [Thermomicrobiaceae bacterium]
MGPGDVVSYLEMCEQEGTSLQRGMNFRLRHGFSVVLMSVRRGAPYADRVEDDGRVLVYEGHDEPRTDDVPDPKAVDQPDRTPNGRLTQNGLFFEAAQRYRRDGGRPELVRVYEKLRAGIWVYNGVFRLVDAWREQSAGRSVFKFRLEFVEDQPGSVEHRGGDIDHSRLIPSTVKLEVWKRDRGRCVICGSQDNLHFDHVIPFSRGGSSLVAENVQLLCARHNLGKRDRIE